MCVWFQVSSYKDTSHTGLGPALILIQLPLKDYLQVQSYSEVLQVRDSTYKFGKGIAYNTSKNLKRKIFVLTKDKIKQDLPLAKLNWTKNIRYHAGLLKFVQGSQLQSTYLEQIKISSMFFAYNCT